MSTFFNNVEQAIKDRNFRYLKHLEFYSGIELRLYRVEKDEYSRVYGRQSGEMNENYQTFCGVLINNDVIPVSETEGGSMTNAILITSFEEDIAAGSYIDMVRSDGRTKRFAVIQKEAIGTTEVVWTQYNLSAVGA